MIEELLTIQDVQDLTGIKNLRDALAEIEKRQ